MQRQVMFAAKRSLELLELALLSSTQMGTGRQAVSAPTRTK